MTNREKLYTKAASALGTHQTLNDNVPKETGCAQAWSAVAKKAGIARIPSTGISGTASLFAWLSTNPAFKEVSDPLPGDTIISPTGYGNDKVRGHVGIVANHGILSNNSENGLWQEHWTLPKWRDYYGDYGGLPVRFFRWI